MTGEPNNPLPGGTDNAAPSTDDNSPDWNYFDPDEDNEEAQPAETDDEVKAEAEEAPEQDADEQAEEKAEEEPAKPALVTLQDGSQVSLDEAVAGYMRQADYTRKQQAVATERTELKTAAERIEAVTAKFADAIASMLPPEPDMALLHTDQRKYLIQKANRDQALQQVQTLIAAADEAKSGRTGLSEADMSRLRASEETKLVQALPETATPEGKRKFFADLKEVADEVGFSDKDLAGVIDHRVFRLAALAREGLRARQARLKAKEKAEKAPPVAPRKPPAAAANRNGEAMRKLTRSGSIHDALAVDFD